MSAITEDQISVISSSELFWDPASSSMMLFQIPVHFDRHIIADIHPVQIVISTVIVLHP